MKKKSLRFFLAVLLFSSTVFAEGIVDDAFDPFADYSDFVDASTEETDINFFKFGRMLSIGAVFGRRSFTGTMGSNTNPGTYFGISFTYYMSLQFATQISYTNGKNSLSYNVPDANFSINGSAQHQTFSFHGKYFINTQNLTKSISRYNPYIIGGYSQITRLTSLSNQVLISAKDSAASFDLGVGAEYMFNNNKNYVGLQLMYHKADFINEDREIVFKNTDDSDISSGIFPGGDPITLQVMLGFNF